MFNYIQNAYWNLDRIHVTRMSFYSRDQILGRPSTFRPLDKPS